MTATADKTAGTAAVQALSPLKQQFDQWRASRRAGERISPDLWDAAVSASRKHGVYRVSRELKLDYVTLKRRAVQTTGGAPATPPEPRFVELRAAQGLSSPAAMSDPACVVELANARGATMRVQLRADALVGLPALCQALWGA